MYYSEFFKYSVALVSSNALSQFIAILIYPVITRLYDPTVFGEFMFFMGIVAVLSIVSTCRYESAIMLPKEEEKAVAVFQLCHIINILFFVLSFIVLFFGKEKIGVMLGQEKLIPLLPIIPFFVLVNGCWQALNYFFIRKKRYYNVSIYNISQSVLNSGLKCLFGLGNLFQSGLIWGQFAGQFVATVISAVAGKSSLKEIKSIRKDTIKDVAKEYSNFPKFELPQDLLNSIAGNLPVLLLSIYFDMKEVGLFSLALGVGLRPISLFGSSIYQVFFRKMTERVQNSEKLMPEILLFSKACLIIILPVFILAAFIPGYVFGMIFSPKWAEVGFYLKLLLPCLFLSVPVASFSFIPDIFFRQKTSLKIEIVYFILKIGSLMLGVLLNSFNLAVISYCGVVSFMLMLKLYWYYRLIKKYELSL